MFSVVFVRYPGEQFELRSLFIINGSGGDYGTVRLNRKGAALSIVVKSIGQVRVVVVVHGAQNTQEGTGGLVFGNLILVERKPIGPTVHRDFARVNVRRDLQWRQLARMEKSEVNLAIEKTDHGRRILVLILPSSRSDEQGFLVAGTSGSRTKPSGIGITSHRLTVEPKSHAPGAPLKDQMIPAVGDDAIGNLNRITLGSALKTGGQVPINLIDRDVTTVLETSGVLGQVTLPTGDGIMLEKYGDGSGIQKEGGPMPHFVIPGRGVVLVAQGRFGLLPGGILDGGIEIAANAPATHQSESNPGYRFGIVDGGSGLVLVPILIPVLVTVEIGQVELNAGAGALHGKKIETLRGLVPTSVMISRLVIRIVTPVVVAVLKGKKVIGAIIGQGEGESALSRGKQGLGGKVAIGSVSEYPNLSLHHAIVAYASRNLDLRRSRIGGFDLVKGSHLNRA